MTYPCVVLEFSWNGDRFRGVALGSVDSSDDSYGSETHLPLTYEKFSEDALGSPCWVVCSPAEARYKMVEALINGVDFYAVNGRVLV